MFFLESSPEEFKDGAEFQAARFVHSAQVGNENAALNALHVLEQNHGTNGSIIEMMLSYYVGQGRIEKAKKMVKAYLRKAHASPQLYGQLADLYLNTGNRNKAVQV